MSEPLMVVCNKCNAVKLATEYKTFATGRVAKSCIACCKKEQTYRNDPVKKEKKRAVNAAYYSQKIKPDMKTHYQKYKTSYKLASQRAYNTKVKRVDIVIKSV
jgi:hypothetical protein